jgi:GTPase SAR1 family protein
MEKLDIIEKCVLLWGPTGSGKSCLMKQLVEINRAKFAEVHGFAPTIERQRELEEIGGVKLHETPEIYEIQQVCGKDNLVLLDNSTCRTHVGDKYDYSLFLLNGTAQIHTFHCETDCGRYLKKNADVIIFMTKDDAEKYFQRRASSTNEIKKGIIDGIDFEKNKLAYFPKSDEFSTV